MDQAIEEDRLKPNEGMRLLDDYEKGLKGQTYLAFPQPDPPAPVPPSPLPAADLAAAKSEDRKPKEAEAGGAKK